MNAAPVSCARLAEIALDRVRVRVRVRVRDRVRVRVRARLAEIALAVPEVSALDDWCDSST